MARNHWTILGELDPELNDKITAWRTQLVNDNTKLERKYRELINVAMACILKQEPVILAHAKLAYQNGATKDEILGTVEQVLTMGGFPSFRMAMLTLDEFFHKVKKKYPEQLFMADCSTIEEALHADELGFDFIGTTMVGYTKQSEGDKIEENDFEILREIVSKVNHKVIAEGNINTPEKARRVLKLGAYSVVVGSIITRPQLITKSFVEAIEK